jgi:hypothetical protein
MAELGLVLKRTRLLSALSQVVVLLLVGLRLLSA